MTDDVCQRMGKQEGLDRQRLNPSCEARLAAPSLQSELLWEVVTQGQLGYKLRPRYSSKSGLQDRSGFGACRRKVPIRARLTARGPDAAHLRPSANTFFCDRTI